MFVLCFLCVFVESLLRGVALGQHILSFLVLHSYRKRELVSLIHLFSCCHVTVCVLCLFHTVSWVGMLSVGHFLVKTILENLPYFTKVYFICTFYIALLTVPTTVGLHPLIGSTFFRLELVTNMGNIIETWG